MTRSAILIGSLLWLALPAGCGTTAPPVAKRTAPLSPAAPPLRIGVLPPDTLPFADVAAALGERLGRAPARGMGPGKAEVVTAKVSMEVAQLSLECVSPTNDCYTAVGKFLHVDRLLWGQINAERDSAAVRVAVVLLDVGRGAAIGRAERSFAEPTAALAGIEALVDEATHAPPPLAPRPTATATATATAPATARTVTETAPATARTATAPATAPAPLAHGENSP